MKYIITIFFIITIISAYGKEYTDSPFSLVSELIKAQSETEAVLKTAELEKLKEKKRIDEINAKRNKEKEEKIRKKELEEKREKEKNIELEKREGRKDKYILKFNIMYPNLVQLPIYSITRDADLEAGLEFEYNRKITKKIDLGAGIIYGTGVSGKDEKGYYRGPEFSVIPIYGVGKYKIQKRILGYKGYIRGVAGYPLILMKESSTTSLDGVAYLGIGAGIDNSRYLLELSYETAIMNIDIVNIEADSSKLMLKAGYIF